MDLSTSPPQAPTAQPPNPKRKRDKAKCEECRTRNIKCQPEVFRDACDSCKRKGLPCTGRQAYKKLSTGTALPAQAQGQDSFKLSRQLSLDSTLVGDLPNGEEVSD